MPPALVELAIKGDVDKRPPFRPLWLANQAHAGLVRQAVALPRIARNAGADDILPVREPALVAWDHVVQIQVPPVQVLSAVLAGVFVALKEIVPGEFHL